MHFQKMQAFKPTISEGRSALIQQAMNIRIMQIFNMYLVLMYKKKIKSFLMRIGSQCSHKRGSSKSHLLANNTSTANCSMTEFALRDLQTTFSPLYL